MEVDLDSLNMAPRTPPGAYAVQPLRFHSARGKSIDIFDNATSAQRNAEFSAGEAEAFSARPVRVNEKIYFRIIGTKKSVTPNVRFGFTWQDPASLTNSALSKGKAWLTTIDVCQMEVVMYYYINSISDVNFCINGDHNSFTNSKVDTAVPLWAMVVIDSHDCIVQFAEPKQYQVSVFNRNEVDADDETIGQTGVLSTIDPLPRYQTPLDPLKLHRTKGKNVYLGPQITSKKKGTFCRGYVFSSQPLPPGRTIVIQIHSVEPGGLGSLVYGFTYSNPKTLKPRQFPDDAMQLLAQPEDWVVRSPAITPLRRGDELAVTLSPDGHVKESTNNSEPATVLHVDVTRKLWAFVDLYKATHKVRILISRKLQVRDPNALVPLNLRVRREKEVNILDDQVTMVRIDSTCVGYLFTARPIRPLHTITIQVFSIPTRRLWSPSVSVGFTSRDPATLRPSDLPENSAELADRPEYWYRPSPIFLGKRDELAFTVSLDGEVRENRSTRNKNPVTVMRVDLTRRLWAFIKLGWDIEKVTLLVTQTVQSLPQEQLVCGRENLASGDFTTCVSATNRDVGVTTGTTGHNVGATGSNVVASTSVMYRKVDATTSMTGRNFGVTDSDVGVTTSATGHNGGVTDSDVVASTSAIYREGGATTSATSRNDSATTSATGREISATSSLAGRDVSETSNACRRIDSETSSNVQNSGEEMCPTHSRKFQVRDPNAVVPRNIRVSTEKEINILDDQATMVSIDFACVGYIFTARPIRPLHTITIQAFSIKLFGLWRPDISVGFTSRDPATLRPSDLPENPAELADRPEYWYSPMFIVSRKRDELAITVSLDGEVRESESPKIKTPVTIMRVDLTRRLWAFIKVTGEQSDGFTLLITQSVQSLPQAKLVCDRENAASGDFTACVSATSRDVGVTTSVTVHNVDATSSDVVASTSVMYRDVDATPSTTGRNDGATCNDAVASTTAKYLDVGATGIDVFASTSVMYRNVGATTSEMHREGGATTSVTGCSVGATKSAAGLDISATSSNSAGRDISETSNACRRIESEAGSTVRISGEEMCPTHSQKLQVRDPNAVVPRSIRVSTEKEINILDEQATMVSIDFACVGYVFTARPIRPLHTITIQVFSIQSGGLWCPDVISVGFTSREPATLRPSDLPENPAQLADGPEYWYSSRSIFLGERDELTITVSLDGEVRESESTRLENPMTIMRVDLTRRLWAFIKLAGDLIDEFTLLITQTVQSLPQERLKRGRENATGLNVNATGSDVVASTSAMYRDVGATTSAMYREGGATAIAAGRDITATSSSAVRDVSETSNACRRIDSETGSTVLNSGKEMSAAKRRKVVEADRATDTEITVTTETNSALREDGTDGTRIDPLRFHRVHGNRLGVTGDGSVAQRIEGDFYGGEAYSSRPLRINEKVCFCVCDISDSWKAAIHLGFTTRDPATLPPSDSTDSGKHWVLSLKKEFCSENAIMYYYVNSGDVYFGVNAEDKALLCRVDESPLWALFNIDGLYTTVHLMDTWRSDHEITNQNLFTREIIMKIKCFSVTETPISQLRYQDAPQMYQCLSLHTTTGTNVQHSSGVIAKIDQESCQAYVFTAFPIASGEAIVIQILTKRLRRAWSLIYGLTSCDPATLNQRDLPDNAYRLRDRPEYWVLHKHDKLDKGDELALVLTPNGEVEERINRCNIEKTILVPNRAKLWAFIDLNGDITKVRMMTSRTYPAQLQTSRVETEPTSRSIVQVESTQHNLEQPSTSQPQERISQSEHTDKEDVCAVCLTEPKDCVLDKCGHMCMCYTCARQVWKDKDRGGVCPICRARIKKVIRIYKC